MRFSLHVAGSCLDLDFVFTEKTLLIFACLFLPGLKQESDCLCLVGTGSGVNTQSNILPVLFKPFLKFCSDTLNSESQGMGLPCIEVKRFDERMFPERGHCNRRLQCYRPTQFSGAEIGSENCKDGICGL